MKPDATIRIRLLTTEEGGRRGAIKGPRYGCALMVKDKGFDCRLLLQDSESLELGNYYEVGVKFLNRESAVSELREGMRIRLWEGKTIANGEILAIHSDTTT
jgi:hypothetical protein